MTRWSFIDIYDDEFILATDSGLQTLLDSNKITQEIYDYNRTLVVSEHVAESFKRIDDDMEIEVDLLERSNMAGAVSSGIQRDASKQIEFRFDINFAAETNWRETLNKLLQRFRACIMLRDYVNSYETEVKLSNINIQWDEGGYNLGAVVSITYAQLEPYWQDIDYQSIQDSSLTSQTFTINNNGYIETPAIITLVAIETCTKVLVKLEENDRGIYIQDNLFGTLGLTTLVIDNQDGTIELGELNRNANIRQGTGFFNLQPGINHLTIETDGAVQTLIEWKRRYYA